MKFLVLSFSIVLAVAQCEDDARTADQAYVRFRDLTNVTSSHRPEAVTSESIGTTTGGPAPRCNGHKFLKEDGCNDICYRKYESGNRTVEHVYSEFVENRPCQIRSGWWSFFSSRPGVCTVTVIKVGTREAQVKGCTARLS
ncbi:uncharacterized protein LOC111247187 [Varroa destructor]|uniref:Uncharacterized protein n=1 Tax=Varroa destructor TaxID=109461 RepID=A0A7M7JLM2_VARDE|nr:uncharacterized protein LOC111247187 [Varroa destructor]